MFQLNILNNSTRNKQLYLLHSGLITTTEDIHTELYQYFQYRAQENLLLQHNLVPPSTQNIHKVAGMDIPVTENPF